MSSEIFRKLPGFLGVLFLVIIFSGCGQADTYDYGTVLEDNADSESFAQAEDNRTGASEDESAGEAFASTEKSTEQIKDPANIYVQVCGAVNSPGVYELSEGARVFEAIEKSGGLCEDAAPDAVNQAVVVTDGALIRIPTTEEWEKMQAEGGAADATGAAVMEADTLTAAAGEDRIDINQADEQTLMTLPGIGQSKAEGIVAYRNEHGSFASIEEIRNVSGIGDKLFQKIKDKIRV